MKLVKVFDSSVLDLHSWNQSHFEFRRMHCSTYDFIHIDRILALWWSDVETLNETDEKEEGLLTTKNLSETGTSSLNEQQEIIH